MKQINKQELIDSIDFTESDYNEKDANATFDEFIEQVISDCRDNNGSFEDAVFNANDAFNNLKTN